MILIKQHILGDNLNKYSWSQCLNYCLLLMMNHCLSIQLGLRYGSMSEDFHTGYRMKCEGWRSMFCYPDRPAFFCDSPVTLNDLLSQCKRWSFGLLGVLLSRYSTLFFGIKKMGLIMSNTYSHHALWPILCIPLTIYSFIPQLALLQGISTFPKVFLLHILITQIVIRDDF